MVLRKCKLKWQWNTTTQALKWLMWKWPSIPSIDKNVEQPHCALLMGMQNGTSTLEDNLAVSYKVKHTLSIRPRNSIRGYSPKRNENIFHPRTYTWLFLRALLIIVENWKHPNVH